MVSAFRVVAFFAAFAACMMSSSPTRADSPSVRALDAKAICVALVEYQRTSPKADLRHFSIIVDRERNNYDIVFLPDRGPGEELLVGGSTKYGAEVHYIISRRTFKILKMHLAR